MAVTFDRSVITLGDHTGAKQSIVAIPAQAATDMPGVLCLEAVADGGVRTRYYYWTATGGGLRVDTAVPTDQLTSGSLVVASGAATPALDNLASVAINTALIPVSTAIDLGTDALPFRTEHLLTSLVLNQTTANYTLTWANPGAARAISIPDPLATATFMFDTGAENVIAYTKGTSTIAMAANADLDIATGITVNIDAAMTITTGLTVNTETVTLNQSLSTTDDVTFKVLTVTTVTDGTASLTAGALSGITTLAMTGALSGLTTINASAAITCKGIVNTTTAIDSTAAIQIGADNVYLTLGAEDATDSKIYFSGSHLTFQDSTGGPYTLQQLATGTTLNPSVTGNLTLLDGSFTWTDAAAEAAAVWTFAGTTTTDITVSSAITTGSFLTIVANSATEGNIISLTADAVTTGTLLYLDTLAAGFNGYYIRCYDNAANDFSVGVDGATIIAGNASGTDALTLTAGDIKVTSGHVELTLGNVLLTNGYVSAPTDQDVQTIFTRSHATGTLPVVKILQSHATPTSGVLHIDSDGTADANAIIIDNAGTGFSVSTTAAAAAGRGYEFISAASGTGAGLLLDGSTGGAAWIGADNTGFAWITSDGVLAAGGNLLRVTSSGLNAAGSFLVEIEQTGQLAAAGDGFCLKVSDTGTARATSYAVNIASTSNEALHVDTGHTLFDETVTISTASTEGVALVITHPDTGSDTNAVEITPSGAGAGIYIAPAEIDTVGIKILTVASTVPMISVDGATSGAAWVGAAATGMVNLTSDGALAADASMIHVASSGKPAAANDGVCLDIVETGTETATSYAVKIDSTNNEALHVATGKSLFDECATFTAGIRTKVAITDVADPPTQANMVTAFGAAATAGSGFIGFLNDANGGENTFLCVSSGSSWYYVAKMTVGAA